MKSMTSMTVRSISSTPSISPTLTSHLSRANCKPGSTTTTTSERPEGERLQKLLARAGFGSRRACEVLIAEGRVRVDGVIATLGTRADPKTARVTVDDIPVVVAPDVVYWLCNKPSGYVTTARDPQQRPTVLELVPPQPRVFPVGRLDLDTEGLLLLTNDGELAQLLTHPSHGVEKEYLAEVEGVPGPAALRALRDGVELDDGMTYPARVRVVQKRRDRSALTIAIHEGRKRQIRRMCEAVGHPVLRLVRVRIGPLRDPDLAPGTYRALEAREVRSLYVAGLSSAAPGG
jgi:23S rRNA pseudouridine2605 synthase